MPDHTIKLTISHNMWAMTYIKGKIAFTVTKIGEQECRYNGKIHRENGPAMINRLGDHLWFKHGKLHRGGGLPAIICHDGRKKWCVNDKTHREDGPALKNSYGVWWWFIDGEQIYNTWE